MRCYLLSILLFACVLPAVCEEAASQATKPVAEFDGVTFEQAVAEVESGKRSLNWLCSRMIAFAESSQEPFELSFSAAKELEGFGDVFGLKLREAVLKALLSAPAQSAQGLLSLNSLLELESHANYESILGLFQAARDSEKLVQEANIAGLWALQRKATEPDQEKIISARLFSLILDQAEQKVSSEPLLVLSRLAEIPQDWRGAKVYELAKRALDSLALQLDTPLSKQELFSEAIDGFVDDLETQLGESVAEKLAQLRSLWVIELVRLDQVSKADRVFEKVIRGRRDPSELNDDLRFQILLEAKSERARDFAKGRKLELQNSGAIDYRRKLSLLLHGYYGNVHLHLHVLVAGTALFLILGLFFSSWRGIARLILRLTGRRKRAIPGYLKPASGMDQYSILLARLGLEDDATDDEIKAAYRRKLKELHPDKSGGKEDEAKVQELIEVKKCYQRILAIKKSSFNT